MDDKLSEEIKEFIIEFCSTELKSVYKKDQLTKYTSVEDDLKITGDDADIFIDAFVRKFDVNFSQFEGRNYFGSESENTDIIWPLIRLIFGKNKKWIPLKKEDREVLTLGMLDKARLKKSW